MAKKNNYYPLEVKLEAIKLKEEGYSVNEISYNERIEYPNAKKRIMNMVIVQ